MKQAIALSRDFTAALEGSQKDTVDRLDEIARAASQEADRIRELGNDRYRAMADLAEAWLREAGVAVAKLHALRTEVLALRAKILDGDDDMARAMAEVIPTRGFSAADSEAREIVRDGVVVKSVDGETERAA